MNRASIDTRQRDLAEAVRRACVRAALEGYESASIAGLCHEGAWEAAVSAMRSLDLAPLLEDRGSSAKPTDSQPGGSPADGGGADSREQR